MTPDIIAEFEKSNFVQTKGYQEGWAEQGEDPGNVVGYFASLDGVFCQWGVPDSDISAVFGLTPANPDELTKLKKDLTAAGAALSKVPDGLLFTTEPDTEYNNYFLLGEDFAAMASDQDLLQVVLDNRRAE